MVKNLPEMQETWVGSLGRKDRLEKGKATHVSILAWRISWTKEAWRATVHEVRSEERLTHTQDILTISLQFLPRPGLVCAYFVHSCNYLSSKQFVTFFVACFCPLPYRILVQGPGI